MQTAASRMATLIRDLLTYSHIAIRQESTTPVGLTEIVEQVTTDLDLLIQDTGTGTIVKIDPLPTVPGDASLMGVSSRSKLTVI